MTTLKVGDPPPTQQSAVSRRFARLNLVLSAAVLFMIFVIVWASYPDLPYYYRFTWKPAIVRYWPNAAAVVTLLVVAYNLYVFRGYKRVWFGLAEIALAAGLCWYAVNKAFAGSIPDAIVIIFASFYLAGRGFVNVLYRLPSFQIPDSEQR